MSFRMKVEDLFRIGTKTVFAGEVETQDKIISNAQSRIEVDGEVVGRILVNGEVHTGTRHRDLWTTSAVVLAREALREHEVWLVSE